MGASPDAGGPSYKLTLYIIGTTPVSNRAVVNIRRFCEDHLRDDYDLKIVDVLQTPTIAKEHQLIALPTLVRERPLPLKRLIGDMSTKTALLQGLEIPPTRR